MLYVRRPYHASCAMLGEQRASVHLSLPLLSHVMLSLLMSCYLWAGHFASWPVTLTHVMSASIMSFFAISFFGRWEELFPSLIRLGNNPPNGHVVMFSHATCTHVMSASSMSYHLHSGHVMPCWLPTLSYSCHVTRLMSHLLIASPASRLFSLFASILLAALL